MTARDRSGGAIPAIGEAISDVREKLVEEAWFGRALTPRPISEAFGVGHDDACALPSSSIGERDAATEKPISEALGWHQPDGARQLAPPQPSPEGHDHGLGIDR